MLARLEVDLPDGSALVAVELIGDEVARLLAGETLALPGYVSPAVLVHEQPAEPEQPEEPEPVEPPPSRTPAKRRREGRPPPEPDHGAAEHAGRVRWRPYQLDMSGCWHELRPADRLGERAGMGLGWLSGSRRTTSTMTSMVIAVTKPTNQDRRKHRS
jgi:hypothetical protein